jgi:tRNA (pseudouridine54-N1)-methyltransferase
MPDSTLLRFVQVLPNVSPAGRFLLRDLPGSGKRIDVLCRDLAACFEWGPTWWERKHLELVAVLGGDITLRFRSVPGRESLGEVGWAKLIKQVLEGVPAEGIELKRQTLANLIEDMLAEEGSRVLVLIEKGERLLSEVETGEFTKNSFMLGDHRGFDSQTEELFASYGLERVSLGETSYLSSHCVAAIISHFERLSR